MKESKIIAQQPKTIETQILQNIWKASHKLSKIIAQAEKLGSNNSSYNDNK